jgi:hypothetical protein
MRRRNAGLRCGSTGHDTLGGESERRFGVAAEVGVWPWESGPELGGNGSGVVVRPGPGGRTSGEGGLGRYFSDRVSGEVGLSSGARPLPQGGVRR